MFSFLHPEYQDGHTNNALVDTSSNHQHSPDNMQSLTERLNALEHKLDQVLDLLHQLTPQCDLKKLIPLE